MKFSGILIFLLVSLFLLTIVRAQQVPEPENLEPDVNVEGENEDIEIGSRFGMEDVKEFARTKLKTGIHKVGEGIQTAANYLKDGVYQGYDYLMRKLDPADQTAQNQNYNQNAGPPPNQNTPVNYKNNAGPPPNQYAPTNYNDNNNYNNYNDYNRAAPQGPQLQAPYFKK